MDWEEKEWKKRRLFGKEERTNDAPVGVVIAITIGGTGAVVAGAVVVALLRF